MNMTDVVNDIKLANGLQTIALPYDKPVELVIQEILQMSIRTFSRFKPWIRETFENREHLASPNEVYKKRGIYILPTNVTTTRVQYADAYAASNQFQSEDATINTFTIGTPFVGFGAYYPQDIVNATQTGAAINKYAGITSNQPTSKWLGFNQIQLFNFPDHCYIQFIVKCDHDPNGETIPDSCVESFMQLATYDVQRTLFNTLKNMNNIGSAFKETQVKIDEWSSAEENRKQLIEKWQTTFHFDDMELVQFF